MVLLIVIFATCSVKAQTDQFRILDGIPHLPVYANTTATTGIQSGGVIYSQSDQMAMIYNGSTWDNLCATVTSIAGNNDYFKIINKIPYLPVATVNPIGTPELGNSYYSTSQLTTLVYDGNDWVKIGDLACSGNDTGVTTKKGSFKFPALGSNPGSGSISEGAIYINTTENIFKVYNGTAWVDGVSCGWIEYSSPLASSEWVNNAVVPITWTAAPDGTTYDLSYSTNGGTTWTPIVNNYSGFTYNWNISGLTAFENNVKINIHDDSYDFDGESDVFITYPPYIVSISRTGSGPICENLDPGSFNLSVSGGSGSQTIQWYEDDDNDLSADATSVGTGITSYDPSGVVASYMGIAHTHYVGAIVTDDNLTNILSEKEVSFAFETACLEIIAPLAGVEWVNNVSQSISWTAPSGGSSYDLSYSINGGSTWNLIANNVSGTSYSWTPSIITTYENDVKLKIHDDIFGNDTESNLFTVYPPFSVLVTRSNGTGGVCDDLDPGSFSAAVTGGSGSNTLQWHEDDDNDLSADAVAVGTGSINYNPSGVHANYLAVDHTHYVGAIVTDNNLSGISASSSDNFQYSTSCIELTAPIAGTQWQSNSSHTISWTNSLGASTYTISYSIDNGSSWNTLSAAATGTSYSWTPSSSGVNSYLTEGKIKLVDNNTSKEVISDVLIIYPPITVSVSRSGSGEVCSANDPGSFSVIYSGGSGSLTAQWYEYNSSSLASGTTVGDGSLSYNPTQVHSSYTSYDHTHYVGVVVTDATLGITNQGYQSFSYKKNCWSCGDDLEYYSIYSFQTHFYKTQQFGSRCWFMEDLHYNAYFPHTGAFLYSVGLVSGFLGTNEYNNIQVQFYCPSGWRMANRLDAESVSSNSTFLQSLNSSSYSGNNGIMWVAQAFYHTGFPDRRYVKYLDEFGTISHRTHAAGIESSMAPVRCVKNL